MFQSFEIIFTNFIKIYFFNVGFEIFAHVTASSRGHPRIFNDGYSYGPSSIKRINKKRLRWLCTASDANRKRCRASIETITVDGQMMLRHLSTGHICQPITLKKDKRRKKRDL